MTEYFRCLKSDFYKLRRCAFFPAHLLFSLCGAALMLIYAGISGSSDSNKLAAFAQIHAIAYPFVVSIVCQIAADQEMRAGHFQNLLTRTSRMKGILSKLTWLFLAGLAAVVISAMLFCSLFPFVTGTQTPAGFFSCYSAGALGQQSFPVRAASVFGNSIWPKLGNQRGSCGQPALRPDADRVGCWNLACDPLWLECPFFGKRRCRAVPSPSSKPI